MPLNHHIYVDGGIIVIGVFSGFYLSSWSTWKWCYSVFLNTLSYPLVKERPLILLGWGPERNYSIFNSLHQTSTRAFLFYFTDQSHYKLNMFIWPGMRIISFLVDFIFFLPNHNFLRKNSLHHDAKKANIHLPSMLGRVSQVC